MSTNSNVAKLNPDGTITSIYGHWDGYLSGVGEILLNHYNSEDRVDALLALGDFSSLTEVLETPTVHTFDSPVPGVSVFYGRDRGEDGVQARTTTAGAEWQANWQQYNYLWKDGQWFYFKSDDSTLRPLTAQAVLQD